MIVELLGLPGAGKSALARETSHALRARGIAADVVDRPISAAVPKPRRLRRRTAAAARAVAAQPAWALSSARGMAAVRQAHARDGAAALAQWLAVYDLAAHARRAPGVHLLEEGPLQTLWTLLLRASGAVSIADPVPTGMLAKWPRAAAPDVVVVLDVPLPEIESRLLRRQSKHSRSQHLPVEALREELLRGEQLLEALAAASRTPVIRLAGSHDTTAAALGARLADLLMPRAEVG